MSAPRRQRPEYFAWLSARRRCHEPSAKNYPRYGGRGIWMCDRWRASFDAFISDMGDRPSPDHSLDRIDNNGPYSPDNCRWATLRVQMRNMRKNVFITHQGRTLILTDWAELLGVGYATLRYRIRKWGVDEAFAKPVGTYVKSSRYAGKYSKKSQHATPLGTSSTELVA